MTFIGVIAAWLAGKMIDAWLTQNQNSPATRPDDRVRPPRRRPGSRRVPMPSQQTVVPPFVPGIPSQPALPAPVRQASTPAVSTPPWPQVVPTGLGAFPGPDWVPDNPPPPAVVQRAQQLEGPLWAKGVGSYQVEQTAGRWIAYQATAMGTKKGVVAWRQRAALPAASTSSTAPASTSPAALPYLRVGSKGQDVKIVQQRLGIPADGSFGPQTQAAVKAFQSQSGLSPDGVVGPNTWAALLGRQAA